jgi:uncharacterized protein (DUF433 family)
LIKKDYVEKRGGGYYVTGTRVSLDSIVYEFRDGASPESIRWSYSVLTLEEVYGAIAYYLRNQKKIDKYLEESEIKFEKEAAERRREFRKANPELYKRLRAARRAMSR